MLSLYHLDVPKENLPTEQKATHIHCLSAGPWKTEHNIALLKRLT